jgi:butyryl-CoA dehydrogenase
MFPQFTEDQSAIREAARDFAMAEIDPGAAARDASGEFPKAILKQLGEMGFLGMCVPEAFGGGGCDFLSYILALEQVAYADASVAVTMSVNNSVACAPILSFGTAEQKANYLKPLASG